MSALTRQGIIVWGFTLVSAAVKAWLAREMDALPSMAATRRGGGFCHSGGMQHRHPGRRRAAQGVQNGGHSRGARLSFRCPVPDSFSLGCHGSISSPHTNPQSSHFLALPDPVADAPVFDPADERGVRHRHRAGRREQLPPPPTATALVADSTLLRNRSLK